jgi:hypothetical protein
MSVCAVALTKFEADAQFELNIESINTNKKSCPKMMKKRFG